MEDCSFLVFGLGLELKYWFLLVLETFGFWTGTKLDLSDHAIQEYQVGRMSQAKKEENEILKLEIVKSLTIPEGKRRKKNLWIPYC